MANWWNFNGELVNKLWRTGEHLWRTGEHWQTRKPAKTKGLRAIKKRIRLIRYYKTYSATAAPLDTGRLPVIMEHGKRPFLYWRLNIKKAGTPPAREETSPP